MKEILEPARKIPVRDEVDVLVVGGGPAGLMAAQAAALEKGTRVMLIEEHDPGASPARFSRKKRQ